MKNKQQHVEYQKKYFDEHSDFFRQSVPPEIEERTRRIVQAAELDEHSRVLDVGTGMGALIKHFLEFGAKAAHITGCDLSSRMLDEARTRYPDVHFWQGDICEFAGGATTFDAVFFNACFGNIIDQARALQVAVAMLNHGGKAIISHPLGNKFVGELKSEDPNLVLTLMPGKQQIDEWCDELSLTPLVFLDEPDFYLTVLTHK